jgi:hypothetical protein
MHYIDLFFIVVPLIFLLVSIGLCLIKLSGGKDLMGGAFSSLTNACILLIAAVHGIRRLPLITTKGARERWLLRIQEENHSVMQFFARDDVFYAYITVFAILFIIALIIYRKTRPIAE